MPLSFEYTPQTELEAVNQLLASIGQSPVNSLEVVGINDVSFSRMALHNTAREVQTPGWWFNREDEYPLSPNEAGEILLPDNIISITPSDVCNDYVERARKLYDRKNHTFNINAVVKCNVVFFFPFEELPQSARAYIARRAGREFQASAVGSQVLYKYTQDSELYALAELQRDENRYSKTNLLKTNNTPNRILHRRW